MFKYVFTHRVLFDKQTMRKLRTAVAALALGAAPFLNMTAATALGEIYPSYIGISASIAANLQ